MVLTILFVPNTPDSSNFLQQSSVTIMEELSYILEESNPINMTTINAFFSIDSVHHIISVFGTFNPPYYVTRTLILYNLHVIFKRS